MVVVGRASVFIVDVKAWGEVAIDGDGITRGQEDVTVATRWKPAPYDVAIRQDTIDDGGRSGRLSPSDTRSSRSR